MKNFKKILVTGAAGFIGARTSALLLSKGKQVIGADNLNDYYDPALKRYRLSELHKHRGFAFHKGDVEDASFLKSIFRKQKPQAVIHLAARAGVRASLENPRVYLATNVGGTLNVLECCKEFRVKKFILASTSSLYAGCPMPFKETLPVNEPISPYAATKKGAEALVFAYHHLYGIDMTVLRYFTVYGPAGRPDMCYFKFIKLIDEGQCIEVYGDGSQRRDFTYVDDIAEGTVSALRNLNYKVINLGGHRGYSLNELIRLLEKYLGKKAKIRRLPFSQGDMKETFADIGRARRFLGWRPKVSFEEGIKRTVEWWWSSKGLVRNIDIAFQSNKHSHLGISDFLKMPYATM